MISASIHKTYISVSSAEKRRLFLALAMRPLRVLCSLYCTSEGGREREEGKKGREEGKGRGERGGERG